MADLKKKLLEITRMKYVDQAKWYLNGFWKDGAENIWKYTNKFIELDDQKKKEGCELNEFEAHKFLEHLGETLTVIQLREKLRKIDIDANGKMALLEYFAFKYSKTIQQIVDAPQGGNQEEIIAAQKKLDEVQTALNQLQQKLEQQQKAEEAVKKAEAEQKAALEELNKQEEAYKSLISGLETKSKDSTISMVQRNKAAAELAQVKGEDPLPLRKAKISQEASVRRVEKERKAAEAATQQVESAVKEMEARCKETEDYLTELKKKGGVAMGAIWWMEREVKEAQKYLPKSKQKL